MTFTHVEMGEAVFGIAPGHAEVWAMLRIRQDEHMANLCAAAEALVNKIAGEHHLPARCGGSSGLISAMAERSG
ncbi:hypothetical protein [Mesorhizobium sp.]|uniref:hypothetical protein n=1 Tax=Mesorhizobium sp. TaxID=1871066 RepID=UPI0025E75810|nr:hypothetical protein [Mesorhizobium sp.]